MRALYKGVTTDWQVQWGDNDDPRGVLTVGEVYEVEKEEVHSFHTKYYIQGRKYNSVHFELERYVIYSAELGIFLGEALGGGFWSKIDPVGQDQAPTFPDREEAREYIKHLNNVKDAGIFPVFPSFDVPTFVPGLTKASDPIGVYATMDDLERAGLPRWDPTALPE